MSSKVTIREVAKLAGVSLGTVSRVINQAPSVRPNARKAVTDAMEQLGYKPNTSAQAMRRGATRTVGIIVRDISIVALAEQVKAAQDVLEPAGYTVVVACSYDSYEREVDLLDTFAKRRVDGLLMTTCSEVDPKLQKIRQSLSIPILYFDRTVDGAAGAILFDHRSSTRAATDYLLDLGHRRIALLTGETMWPFRERIQGYHEAFEKHGLAAPPSLIRQQSQLGTGGEALALDALHQPSRPTALIAGGFNLLPGVIRTLRSLRLRVPEDVSVIAGFDSELAQLLSPAVTAIRLQPTVCGQTAAEVLLQRLHGRLPQTPHDGIHLLATELILRDSCAPPRDDA